MKLKITLGQMNVELGNVSANFETVKKMTAAASERGSDLVVFPELWSTGYDLGNAETYATNTRSGVFSKMTLLARKHNIAIAGSALSIMKESQIGNTAVLVDRYGHILGEYSKLHLFRLMDEDRYLTAGSQLSVVESAWGKIGLAICYDLRFPELFRSYALLDAWAVILPAEWPKPRLMHWRTLLRARAIENQMYVIACNRVGRSGDTAFFGHSCIIDPWGEIIIEGNEEEGLFTAEIDMEVVTAVRKKMPVFADRRPQLYAQYGENGF